MSFSKNSSKKKVRGRAPNLFSFSGVTLVGGGGTMGDYHKELVPTPKRALLKLSWEYQHKEPWSPVAEAWQKKHLNETVGSRASRLLLTWSRLLLRKSY